uniref:Putative LOV domain-containing protein n=1 Tax=Punctaria latifolia TaxID=90013 RepID=A0A126WUU4_9PHAE|nr:putative LOV domain-containing protein [Punctaria latifolia]
MAKSSAAEANGKKRRKMDNANVEQKFQEQIVRRRERNRVLARQTRMRKKFFYQSLQKQMAVLRSENRALKSILTDRLGDKSKQVIYDCTTELSRQVVQGRIGEDDEETVTAEMGVAGGGDAGGTRSGDGGGGKGARRDLSRPDYRLMKSLQTAQQNFVVTEPSLPDNPIVFASDGFLKLTGYTSKQVIGNNCRFLQGPDTDKRAVATVRQAIEKGEDASVCFLNYKADGTPFWNQFFVAPLRDDKNRIVNYVGAQCLVPGPLPPERPTPTAKPPESIRGGKGSRGGGGRSSKGRGVEGIEGTPGDGDTGDSSSGKGDGNSRSKATPRGLEENEGRREGGGEGLSGEIGVEEESHTTHNESPKTAVGRNDGGLEEGVGEEDDDDKEGEWNRCLVAADAAESAAASAIGFGGEDDDIMNLQGTASVDADTDGEVAGAVLQTDGLVML